MSGGFRKIMTLILSMHLIVNVVPAQEVSAMGTEEQTYAEVNNISLEGDFQGFNSGVRKARIGEKFKVHAKVNFSGDEDAIRDAAVSFHDTDHAFDINYDRDSLSIQGRQGEFDFELIVKSDEKPAYLFSVSVSDGLPDNTNHLSPYSQTQTIYTEIPSDDSESEKDLWRDNEDMPELADPMILNNVKRDGKYYAYGTTSSVGFNYYVSKDLENWTGGEECLNFASQGKKGWTMVWAPEVVYDKDLEKYIMYFSATPPKEDVGTDEYVAQLPLAATSDSPAGPFTLVDFLDEASCGSENIHTYDQKLYPQTYSRNVLFDMDEYVSTVKREAARLNLEEDLLYFDGKYLPEGQFIRNIDLSPYEDPDTGKKYLMSSATPNCNVIMEMENWLKPKYETYTVLSRASYYTVEDWVAASNGEEIEKFEYELNANECNEGPFMIKHNGLYYLSFSMGSYTQNAYSVIQAVAESPMGPFHKLDQSENGPLLNADLGENKSVSGPGHHSFVIADVGGEEKLFIAYHAHNQYGNANAGRHLQLDECRWVTIKDKNNEDLDVLHVNGPTKSKQPTFGVNKEYTVLNPNRMSLQLEKGQLAENSSPDYMTDGLLSINNKVSKRFNDQYIRETLITQDSTFLLSMNEPVKARGIMFYNSSDKDRYFETVTNIELICEDNGVTRTFTIPDLEIDEKTDLVQEKKDGETILLDVVRGAGLRAEFNTENVKAIRFTVNVPEGKSVIGIPEVSILGKESI